MGGVWEVDAAEEVSLYFKIKFQEFRPCRGSDRERKKSAGTWPTSKVWVGCCGWCVVDAAEGGSGSIVFVKL